MKNSVFGQVSITGKVTNSNQESLQFANVFLVNPKTSNVVSGAMTDEDGVFQIRNVEQGKYGLKISLFGFITQFDTVEITTGKDIGVYVLTEEVDTLDQVIVVGKRKLIERKIDRLVFNVEYSPQSSQGDAIEVLKVTPGVRVQNDNIGMIGKSSVAVMIDGKILRLSSEDLANFLKTIPSEDIKSVEVITTPPAKYEALGNSGLINIRLKKAKRDSWNALVRVGYWQRTYANGSTGVNFNYNKNKLSIASSVFYRDGLYLQEQDDYAYFPDGLWYTKSPFKARVTGINGRADINYQLKDNWSIGAQYLFNQTKYAVTDHPYTPVLDYTTNEVLRFLQSEGAMDLKPTINAINLNSTIQLDTTGKQFTVNTDYFTYTNLDVKSYSGHSKNLTALEEKFYRGQNVNDQNVVNYSGAIDFDFPTNWAVFTFGGKITQSVSDNSIAFFNSGFVDQPVNGFVLEESNFNYVESTQALYLSGSKSLGKKWESQLGLRLESTQTNARSDFSNLNQDFNFVKLFPTFYVAYSPDDKNTFGLNYGKRINRPQFFDLNPNAYFVNPFQTISGNPFLQPSFVDNLEFSHTYKSLSTRVCFSNEEGVFGQVSLPDSTTNVIRFTNENYINTKRVGFALNYGFYSLKWWSCNAGFDINYSHSEFDLESPQEGLKGINSRFFAYNNFILDKKKNVLVGLNFWYSLPGVDGIFQTQEIGSFSLYFQYLMLKKQLRFTIRGNDIFRTEAERLTTTINGVFQEARYYYDAQSVFISLSYKFGNNNIRAKQHNTGNEDERNRTGN